MGDPNKGAQRTAGSESTYVFTAPDASIGGIDRRRPSRNAGRGAGGVIDFQPGDVQLVNNLTILHARTGHEDWPEADRKRHLLRFWIALPDAWPLPQAWYGRNGIDEETGRPSGIVVPGMEENLSLQPT